MKVQVVVFKTKIGTPADLLGDGIQRQKVLEMVNDVARSAQGMDKTKHSDIVYVSGERRDLSG